MLMVGLYGVGFEIEGLRGSGWERYVVVVWMDCGQFVAEAV